MPEPGSETLITNAATGIIGSHDIILHSLDDHRPYVHGDGRVETLFYGSDVFKGTEKGWETIPVILGKRHPSTPYSVNPAKALQEAEGVVVGSVSDVHITDVGSPLLRSKLHLTDESAETLLKSRKMALSSGFISGINDGNITGVNGRVIPDHILAFEQSRTNQRQDKAALILNSTEGNMPEDDSIKKVLTDFIAELKTLIIPAKAEPAMPAMPEPTGMVSNMTEAKIAELEQKLAKSDELIKNMTDRITGYEKEEADRKVAETNAKWQLVKNSIAPGLTATPEQEKAARTEWETDSTTFFLKNATAKKEETSPDGVQFVKNSNITDDADAEYLKFIGRV